MMQIRVTLSDDGLRARLATISHSLEDAEGLNSSMARGVETLVRDHLAELGKSRSPNTNYYGKASRSVESETTPEMGLVRVPHRGVALRYYGGRVTPVERKNLALPTEHVPIRGEERLRPGEMQNLVFIPNTNAVTMTSGYLVEGVEKAGKDGRVRLVPKPGGRLMYVLRKQTDHKPDPTVLPDQVTITDHARDAAMDFLAALIQGEEGGQHV